MVGLLLGAPPVYSIIMPDKLRFKLISDCNKELENDITYYRRVLGKLTKVRSACHTTYTVTGVTSAVLSTSDMAVSLSGIGIIAGALIAALAGFLGFISVVFSVGSKNLNLTKKKNRKKHISITEAEHMSVSKLFSKAIENNSVSDMEFNSIFHEIEQYNSVKRQLK